ncbi:hypothetical protein BC830DRAFT_1058394 [Chytriomyces sp. MP71]|nr:hypothetical protein BC830DRAFT_1058394 [Chytriomyces sp. MP71]
MAPSNPLKFSVDALPDLAGRTYVVTGGNTGIGLETCLQLAKKNATVVLASRSEERAMAAVAKIREQVPTARVDFLPLVLNDLKQVAAAASELATKHPRIDALINNAGIMASPFALSKDGIEDQFATNHVGHFLFTTRLIPNLLNAERPRIVNVSSSAHTFAPNAGGILFDKINDEKAMSVWERYGQSKLANILFSVKLDKLYGDRIYVNSVHPGVVDTELTRSLVVTYGSWMKPIIRVLKAFGTISPADGALTQLYAAAHPDIEEKKLKARVFFAIANDKTDSNELSTFCKNADLADKLWEFTEALIKEKGL